MKRKKRKKRKRTKEKKESGRLQCLGRLTIIVLNTHDKAIRSPNSAADSKGRPRIWGVPLWTPLGNDALGVSGNVVPAVGISGGRRRGRWLVTNEDSSIPGAADPRAGSFVDHSHVLPIDEVFDAILDVSLANASGVGAHAVFLRDMSVPPLGLFELKSGAIASGAVPIISGVDFTDLPHNLLDGSVESQRLAVGSEGTRVRVRDHGEILEERIDIGIRH